MTNVSDELQPLHEAIEVILRRAQAALTFSKEPKDIKRACDALSDALSTLLRAWNAIDAHVSSSVRGLLDMVQRNCKHPNAQRGYNERDGNWMNPCLTCGKSE